MSVVKLLVALAALVLATTACSGDDPPSPTAPPAKTTLDLGTGDVSCPDEAPERQQNVDFRRTDPASPRLEAILSILPLDTRSFCAESVVFDPVGLAERIVSFELTLGDDEANYGEHYGATDPDGSEELLNFPFSFTVHGPCRDVTAEIVLRADGAEHTYRAETSAGPKCPEG